MQLLSFPATSFHPTVWVDLDVPHAVDLARQLAQDARWPRPLFLVDGHAPACQRTLGVSHLVSQLLVLHRAGVGVQLLHPNEPLRRCLHLLGLSNLFHVGAM